MLFKRKTPYIFSFYHPHLRNIGSLSSCFLARERRGEGYFFKSPLYHIRGRRKLSPASIMFYLKLIVKAYLVQWR